jgi:hypothetical protein
MKTQVNIVETLEKISIGSPRSQSNNAIFKDKGGSWNPDDKTWDFDDTEVTRKMISDLFGDDSPLVCARVPKSELSEVGNQWKVGGYVAAHRQRCDGPVAMPPGVQLEKGQWTKTGGTPDEPRVVGDDDVVLTVVMRRDFAERMGLEILESENSSVINRLKNVPTKDLVDELERRRAAGECTKNYEVC